MTKTKKIVMAVIAVLVLAGIGVGGFMVNQKKIQEQQAQEEQALKVAYYKQSSTLNLAGYTDYDYGPYSDKYEYSLYLRLAFYEKETGNVLEIDAIKEYGSQEYEDDGTIRIYTNGRHPEIQAIIDWYYLDGTKKRFDKYVDELITIKSTYVKEEYLSKGLESPLPNFTEMPLDQLDELIKKEADPSYEMQFDFG